MDVALTVCLTYFKEMDASFLRKIYHVWDLPTVSLVVELEFAEPIIS